MFLNEENAKKIVFFTFGPIFFTLLIDKLGNYWTIFSQFWPFLDPLFLRCWSTNWEIIGRFFLNFGLFWTHFFYVFDRQIGKLLDDFFSILSFFVLAFVQTDILKTKMTNVRNVINLVLHAHQTLQMLACLAIVIQIEY